MKAATAEVDDGFVCVYGSKFMSQKFLIKISKFHMHMIILTPPSSSNSLMMLPAPIHFSLHSLSLASKQGRQGEK